MTEKIIWAAIYFAIIIYLGWKGYKETKVASDYMLAGRSVHPFIMSMSYGSTFISTSAIIGFGGAAAMWGFPLLWLTFFNIFFGIFLAFVFCGKRTRRMGSALDAHTFPELLGRRYQSRFIQGFSGGVIFLFMPVYAAAVLIGVARLLEVNLGISYGVAVFIFTAITALYVITGGMKAVMYTDAFQACLMFVIMAIFVYWTYHVLGGFTAAHQALTDLALNPAAVAPIKGHPMLRGWNGWTQGLAFGTPTWLIVYTTIVYGVGIGVLAQPQLAVRFMTVKSDKELNRGVMYGGPFLLCMTGVAFVVGALSNVVFFKIPDQAGKVLGQVAFIGGDKNIDKIIPAYITSYFPDWFATFFLLAMFAAAMSTLSGQFHAAGTSLGRDLYEKGMGAKVSNVLTINRLAALVAVLLSMGCAFILPESVIAKATAFFFGLCSATFLPMFILGLTWKGMTKAAAIASMLGGFAVSFFLLMFLHTPVSKPLGICKALFGVDTLLAGHAPGTMGFNLQFLDPNIVAMPVAFLIALLVAMSSAKFEESHINHCWRHMGSRKQAA
jgi:SSS family solute:Na+ symporter